MPCPKLSRTKPKVDIVQGLFIHLSTDPPPVQSFCIFWFAHLDGQLYFIAIVIDHPNGGH